MISEELRKRIVTGSILAGVFVVLDLLAIQFFAVRVLVAILGFAAIALCGYEVGRFTCRERKSLRIMMAILFVLPPLFVIGFGLGCDTLSARQSCLANGFAVGTAVAALFLLLTIFISARKEIAPMVEPLLTMVCGLVLIGLGGAAFVAVALLDRGGVLVGWLVAVVCSCDIAAYFVGRQIGGPKLAPAISPGKTVSGTIGGVVAAGIVGAFLHGLMSVESSLWISVASASTVAVAAQCGDLTKSLMKRIWNVKDSGTLLPGHGGVLDRIDGLLGGSLLLWASLLAGGL
jgi:CDP-diglyceride synthetase